MEAARGVADHVRAWRERAARIYAHAGTSVYVFMCGGVVVGLFAASSLPVAWHYNWTTGRAATRPVREDPFQAWTLGAISVLGAVVVVGSLGVMVSQARFDRAQRRGGGPGSQYAATVAVAGGTLSLYDRVHHPAARGPDGRSGLDDYLAVLDDAMERGAQVGSNGRILLVLLDGPDNDLLPAEVRISRDPSDAAAGQVAAGNPFAVSFPSGELVIGAGDGSLGREADVPPGDYEVAVSWRTVDPQVADGVLESIAFVLRPVTAIPSWVEGPVRLRLESDRIIRI